MGRYADIVLGEVAGTKVGLTSDLMLWEHSRKMNLEESGSEYLIGFGVGFTKGQGYRKQLRERLGNEPLLKDAVDALLWQLKENKDWNFQKFDNNVGIWLSNMVNWSVAELDISTYEQSREYLKKNMLQRALDIVLNYYIENHRLIAWRSYEVLHKELHKVRHRKQRGQLMDSKAELNEISNRLAEWLEYNRP